MVILIFAKPIVAIFTTDSLVLTETPEALRWVFAASPIIAVQLIGAAYFQAAGKAKKALAFDLKQTRFFPDSVSAYSTKFFRYFWSVDCIPNC